MADRPGRPKATTNAELERIALQLFHDRGFDATTVDDIADAAGIARRTFFRYYPSKNDVVWGEFERLLDGMREWLQEQPPDAPVLDAIARAVVRFNSLPREAMPSHRHRMSLILRVPALQAHSTLRYAEWRAVVAGFVADRTGTSADEALPRLVGHLSLAVAVASYEQWLADPSASLEHLLIDAFDQLRTGLPTLGR